MPALTDVYPTKGCPAHTNPGDHFVRGAHYVARLPRPQSDREAIAALILMSVMRNVSAPFGIADPDRPNVSTTIWQTITDLTNGVLYYDSVVSPQVFWLEVKKLRLTPASPCAS
jgi:penicillin V acylase-like amidase (Ntn superfamily)